MCRSSESPIDRIKAALDEMPDWMSARAAAAMGQVVLDCHLIVNRTEGFAAEATRRFEKSGGYKADGALGIVPWLKDKAKLGGGDAAQHVQVARQLEQLPRTEAALARGEIGYPHAVAMARTAEHVGVIEVRKAETSLLKAAATVDVDQFVGVVRNFEHQVDADAALEAANRAHQRRYLSIGEPINGLARIEGQLVPEAAAIIRTSIEPFMKPAKGDERTAGQRMHDALIEALRLGGARRVPGNRVAAGHTINNDVSAARDQSASSSHTEHAAPRVQVIIKASADTLAGLKGAPAGELEWGGTIPAETVANCA